MTRITSFSTATISAAVLALALLGACETPPMDPPPEGFRLVVRFVSVDVAVIDGVRLRLQPPDGARFATVPDTMFEDDRITLRSDSDSSLVFEIDGQHVRDHAVLAPDGTSTIYELQIWSDDPVMRADGPLVIGSASRSGADIAQGTAYLPAWPPPVEVEGMCEGTTCTSQIAIECTSEAAGMGLCRP